MMMMMMTTSTSMNVTEGYNLTCLQVNASAVYTPTNCSAGNSSAPSGNSTYGMTFEEVMSIVAPILYSLIIFIGFVGNLLVIIVVVSNKQMRNTTNILIINLAVADMLFIVICVSTTTVSYITPTWPFGDVMCRIVQYINFVTAYVSIYTLVLMALDRYLAVVHAVTAINIRTQQNAYICVIATWVLTLSVNIPTYFAHFLVRYSHEGQMRAACLAEPSQSRAIFTTFFVFGYILPLLFIIVLYGFMLSKLLSASGRVVGQSAESMRSRRRVTKLVIIVVVVFLACWLPNHVLFFIMNWSAGGTIATSSFVVYLTVARMLAYTNSCINPILYAFLSENFRKGFKRILCMAAETRGRTMDFERTNTRPLLTGTTIMRSLKSVNENGL